MGNLALLAGRLRGMERLAREFPGFDTCKVLRASLHPLTLPTEQLVRKTRQLRRHPYLNAARCSCLLRSNPYLYGTRFYIYLYRATKFAGSFRAAVGRPLPRRFFSRPGSEVALRCGARQSAAALHNTLRLFGRDAAYVVVLRNPAVMFADRERAVRNLKQLGSVFGGGKATKMVLSAPGLLCRRDITDLAKKIAAVAGLLGREPEFVVELYLTSSWLLRLGVGSIGRRWRRVMLAV